MRPIITRQIVSLFESRARLVDERHVEEVGPAYAEVEHVDLLHDGVVERVQKPRRVRHCNGEEDIH